MGFLDILLSFVSSPLLIISVVFWVVSFALVKILGKKKENVVIFFPFLVLFKTKKLNRLFRKIGSKGKKFWKIFWNIGVVASFGLMAFALYFFISNLVTLIINPQPENAILPLIPGVTIDLPEFSYFILPLLLVITIHEFSHAIAAENDGVDVQSSGLMGAGIFFVLASGAFVEVDEFQLYSKKHTAGTRLRVAAAGVWSNVITAGIIFLIMLNISSVVNIGYQEETFRVTGVSPAIEGGFNEGNLVAGDIVLRINNTIVDAENSASLSEILDNQTALKCKPGDELILTCTNTDSKQEYERKITLGFRYTVGFEFEQYNNTAFKITEVYSTQLGGNNEGLVYPNDVIVAVDGQEINYDTGNSFHTFLMKQQPNYKMNLTNDMGTNITIDVNYIQQVAFAHLFRDIFTGLELSKKSNTSFQVLTVLNNGTEKGINEGAIPENTEITKINGISVDLENYTLKEFMDQRISPIPGESLIFETNDGKQFTIATSDIPVIYTNYIGIYSETYWVPRNFIGQLFGGTFPSFLILEIFYTWMISFSVALFNLLPSAIFDGGRMVKELIDLGVGKDQYDMNARQKLRYEYNPEDPKQHLMTQSIFKVHGVQKIEEQPVGYDTITDSVLNEESTEDAYKRTPLEYETLDTSKDGYLDSIQLINPPEMPEKQLIEVDIEFEKDLKGEKKKSIYKWISWSVGLMILANLLISTVKFGSTFFWL